MAPSLAGRQKSISLTACVAAAVSLTVLAAASAPPSARPGTHGLAPSGTIAVASPTDFRSIVLISPATGSVVRVRAPDTLVGQQVDLSPNGARMTFAGSTGIWILSRTGRSARRALVASPSATFVPDWVAWSPDARRLVFTRAEALYVVGVSGAGLRPLRAGRAYAPDWWSPGSIVFVRRPSLRTGSGLVTSIRSDGRGLRSIVRGGHPDVSPDGSTLAFTRRDGIYVQPLRGGTARRIVPRGEHPEWSPDGRHLAFTRAVRCGHAGCEGRVFVMRATGGEARPVGPRIFEIGPLSWSR